LRQVYPGSRLCLGDEGRGVLLHQTVQRGLFWAVALAAALRSLTKGWPAMSMRTGDHSRAPALKGKTKCAAHGGKSTGPRTPYGKARIGAAQLVHGRETRKGRTERSLGLARLAALEALGRSLGLISGPLTRGPQPGSR
jgi:hypothetical protein